MVVCIRPQICARTKAGLWEILSTCAEEPNPDWKRNIPILILLLISELNSSFFGIAARPRDNKDACQLTYPPCQLWGQPDDAIRLNHEIGSGECL